MTFETEEEIYNHLYDPTIEDKSRYSRETLCTWIRATINSAISQGVLLGIKRENQRAMKIIEKRG